MTDNPDQPTPQIVQTQTQSTSTSSDPIVEEMVTQALDIQQTFAQNDTQETVIPVPASDSMIESSSTDDIKVTTPDTALALATVNQNEGKSPLDILEEILGKSEQSAAESEPTIPEKSDEQMKAEHAILMQQQNELLEQQRKILHTEVTSGEQQQRDVVRQEQQTLNEVVTDHDIYQIKREKLAQE